jgi:hypothetical protein
MSDPSNDIITRFVNDIVARVIGDIGEIHIRSVFVGGSVAVGEALVYRAADTWEVYSDVDLYVVVDDTIDLEEARWKAREIGSAAPLSGAGYRFYRRPDIGVYTFEDLARQPARPGTAGLDRNHRMCYGDESVPISAARRIGSRIPDQEALYLLENRLGELADVERAFGKPGSGVSSGYRSFVLCKTAMDAAGASLIVRGDYSPRRSQRFAKLSSLARSAESDRAWSENDLDIVRRCGERLNELPVAGWGDADPGGGADKIVSLVLDRWKCIADDYYGGEPAGWDDRVLRRCGTGEYLGNFRQFRALNARCGFKKRGAIAAGVHLSRYSPVDALRLGALMDYLTRHAEGQPDVDRLESSLGSFLERLTNECGFTDGSLSERVWDMKRAVG